MTAEVIIDGSVELPTTISQEDLAEFLTSSERMETARLAVQRAQEEALKSQGACHWVMQWIYRRYKMGEQDGFDPATGEIKRIGASPIPFPPILMRTPQEQVIEDVTEGDSPDAGGDWSDDPAPEDESE